MSEITFEEGITQIADNLFRGSNLESVTIPGSVTKIGISAFQGCDQLKEIIIPDSVTEIGTSAFQECKALTSVRLSLGLKQLNGMTFRYCTSLNKINIPKSLKEVGSSAEFYECPLTEITFEERTTQIADNLFRGSNIESVTIPGSVTKIGIYAFYGCKKLKEIVIPDNVTEIGCSAFERCESLTTVQLPSGLKQLNGQTFNSCTSLNKINIPKSLEKTDMGPEFNGCPLSEITFEEGIIRIADNLFSYSKLENVTIPSTVQRIGKRSFKNCEELQTIYIPERTTIIDDSSFENCGNSVKILAKTGTYAEEYADEQGIQFESNGVWDYGLNLRYDGFSFVNTYNSFGYEKGYKIPDERVDEVYNCNKYWKNKNSLKNEKNKEWFGSCFGMCIMAIKFSNGEINVSDYISDASSGHNVVNANDIYYDFTKFDDEDNDEKRKIKCIQKDGELTKAIERYQIMQSSYQVNQRMRDYQKMMEKKKNNLQDYFADYVGYLRRASELEEKKKEQWLVNLHWKEDRVDKGKVKTVNTGHIVAVDTSRYPVESENGWIRIFIYDPNYPYWGKSVEGVDPQFTNKDAMSCYIDVNIETGKWYTSHMITYKGNRMHIGQYEYEDKPEKADNGDIYFFPASIVPLFNGEKYDTMYDAPGKNVTFYGDNISVYNADNSELVFELKNGEETVVGDAVQDKNYFSGSTNATSNAGIVFLVDGNYSIIADDTEVSFGQDGNYFTLASSGKTRVDMSSATDITITSLSGNNMIDIAVGDKTSNEKYTAIQTALSIDETPCKISLKEDKLTVDTDISQKLDVDIITEEGEGKISDVPVDKLDDFNLRETEVETDLGEVLKSDVPADGVIPEGIWIAGVKDQDYTGAKITQDIRVYDGKKRLREKTDYTISYKNNTKAYELAEGDAGYQAAKAPTMIVTTKGDYTGKITVTFKINQVSVAEENAEIVIDAVTSAYNKKNQTPDPTVTWKGKKLSKGKDYTVSYQDANGNATACKNIGTYQIVVSGKGNFCGTRNVAFTIVDPSQLTLLSKAKISKIPVQNYTGNEITVESMLAAGTLSKFEVKVGNKVLTQNIDYTLGYRNNKEVGTATVIIKAAEGSAYSGQKLVTFKINGIAIGKASVDKVPNQTYTGEAIEPELVVKDASGKLLQKDVNYTVAYTNQVNAGKATATITGIGDYSGTKKVTYKIQQLGINDNKDIVVNRGSEIVVSYEKGGAKPSPIVEYKGKKLRAGVDYTLSYNNNNTAEESNPAKQPTIVIKGKGNFTGTINQTFTIKKQDLGKVTLSLVDMPYKAGKSNIYKTKYKLIDTNGQVLSANKDYDAKTVQYTYVNDTVLENGQTVKTAGSVVGDKDIIPNGTQIQLTVYAVAGGNYTEKATGTYMIGSTVLDINKATVKVPVQQYTGKEIMLHVQKDANDKTGYTITYGKTKTALVEGTDYEVVGYSNNINKGKAKMTIRGLGKYSGTKIVTFTIKERNANDWWSNIINRFASIFNR